MSNSLSSSSQFSAMYLFTSNFLSKEFFDCKRFLNEANLNAFISSTLVFMLLVFWLRNLCFNLMCKNCSLFYFQCMHCIIGQRIFHIHLQLNRSCRIINIYYFKENSRYCNMNQGSRTSSTNKTYSYFQNAQYLSKFCLIFSETFLQPLMFGQKRMGCFRGGQEA